MICHSVSKLVVLCTTLFLTTPSLASILLMLEGTGGAGKSTLSKMLARHMPEACIIAEPFERWNSNHWSRVSDDPALGNAFTTFLHDKKRWALTFQNYVFLTHYQALEDAYKDHPDKALYISDRSHFSGIFTYARMFLENGYLNPMEWAMFQENAWWLVEHLPYKPDGFIYLRTQPTTACKRANKRNRAVNESLNLPYYETLHRYHEEWLLEKKNVPQAIAHIPVLVLDGELDFEGDPAIQEAFVQQIKEFAHAMRHSLILQ
ncbi:MAG TPA: deoxynucleoside kinase [Candidatus Limnocylindria bacterium]|nr:deoxynucleoside kinase [Candidatus Limnocylindria bacterium]